MLFAFDVVKPDWSWKTDRIDTTHRPIVVHLHLFKNAGTSVERGLQSFFAERWRSFDLPESGSRVSQHVLIRYLNENPDIEAVSSHQIRPPLESTTAFSFLPIVYVRDPLDRIRSAWEFERHQGDVSPSSRVASQSTLLEWVDWHRGRGSTQCTNFQTYGLTSHRSENGAPRRALPIDVHLESAKGFLARLGAVGVVERYEESWRAISSWIDETFDGFDAPVLHENQTDADSKLVERLDRMSDMIGPAAFEQLQQENAADYELHDFAMQLTRSGPRQR